MSEPTAIPTYIVITPESVYTRFVRAKSRRKLMLDIFREQYEDYGYDIYEIIKKCNDSIVLSRALYAADFLSAADWLDISCQILIAHRRLCIGIPEGAMHMLRGLVNDARELAKMIAAKKDCRDYMIGASDRTRFADNLVLEYNTCPASFETRYGSKSSSVRAICSITKSVNQFALILKRLASREAICCQSFYIASYAIRYAQNKIDQDYLVKLLKTKV